MHGGPERRSDFAVQVGDAGEFFLGAVIGEALLPDGHRRVDAPHAERDVALLLADPRARARVELVGQIEGGAVALVRLGIGVEGGGGIAGGL